MPTLLLGFAPVAAGEAAEARPDPFRVIAHRGASAYAPENTLPAFAKALALGAHEVELDVQLTRDDQLILFHDETLDEKTDGRGRVREHDLAALRALEIGSWFDAAHPEVAERFAGTRLVGLSQLFEAFGRELFYHIELKSDELALPAAVLALVSRHALADRVMITSFQTAQLERTRALDPAIPISLLVDRKKKLRQSTLSGDDRAGASGEALQRRWIEAAAARRFDQVGFPAQEISRPLVDFAHAKNLECRAWSIRSRSDVQRALDAGANGMTINWPDWLIDPPLPPQPDPPGAERAGQAKW